MVPDTRKSRRDTQTRMPAANQAKHLPSHIVGLAVFDFLLQALQFAPETLARRGFGLRRGTVGEAPPIAARGPKLSSFTPHRCMSPPTWPFIPCFPEPRYCRPNSPESVIYCRNQSILTYGTFQQSDLIAGSRQAHPHISINFYILRSTTDISLTCPFSRTVLAAARRSPLILPLTITVWPAANTSPSTSPFMATSFPVASGPGRFLPVPRCFRSLFLKLPRNCQA